MMAAVCFRVRQAALTRAAYIGRHWVRLHLQTISGLKYMRYMLTHACTHAHTHICMHMHTCTHIHTHTYTHTHTHARTRVHLNEWHYSQTDPQHSTNEVSYNGKVPSGVIVGKIMETNQTYTHREEEGSSTCSR